jgi:hypothetical protein
MDEYLNYWGYGCRTLESTGNGYGDGLGYGNGYGNGYGYGSGDGSGDGCSIGFSNGKGYSQPLKGLLRESING